MSLEVPNQEEAAKSKTPEAAPSPERVLVPPKSELKVVRESKGPIVEIDPTTKEPKVEQLIAWGDHTLVLRPGEPNVLLYNDGAQPVTDVPAGVLTREISVNWQSERITQILGGDRHLTLDPNRGTLYKFVGDLPESLQVYAQSAIRKAQEQDRAAGRSPRADKGVDQLENYEHMPVTRVEVLEKGAFIVLLTDVGCASVIETRNDRGAKLSPKHWSGQRRDPGDKYPSAAMGRIHRLLNEHRPNQEMRPLTKQYSLGITSESIQLIDTTQQPPREMLTLDISGAQSNVTRDPKNPNVIWFCKSSNPRSFHRLDLERPEDQLTVEDVPLSANVSYTTVRNLQHDPSGRFLTFESDDGLVVLAKDGLIELGRHVGLRNVHYDQSGHLRAINKRGQLLILRTNFKELEGSLDEYKMDQIAIQLTQKFAAIPIHSQSGQPEAPLVASEFTKYIEQQQQSLQQFQEMLVKITTIEGFASAEAHLIVVLQIFESQPDVSKAAVDFFYQPLREALTKRREIVAEAISMPLYEELGELIDAKLTLEGVAKGQALRKQLEVVRPYLVPGGQEAIDEVFGEFATKSAELYKAEAAAIRTKLAALVGATKIRLGKLTTYQDMLHWRGGEFIAIREELLDIAKGVPASAYEIFDIIREADTALTIIREERAEQLKAEHERQQEAIVSKQEARKDDIRSQITDLFDIVREHAYTERTAAELFLRSSDARKFIEDQIADIERDQPSLAKELSVLFREETSKALLEVEQSSLVTMNAKGEEMFPLGGVPFPKWKGKAKRRRPRKSRLDFDPNEQSKASGTVSGDVIIRFTSAKGDVTHMRLFEGREDETDWMYGFNSYHGAELTPTYLTTNQYTKLQRDYSDWQKPNSALRAELEQRRIQARQQLMLLRRQKRAGLTPADQAARQGEIQQLLDEYATFLAEHNVPLLRRIDEVRSLPELETSNGKGFVPEWSRHWSLDSETDAQLGRLAKKLLVQLEGKSGCLMLEGHAGTGKDVLVRIFCHLTGRPFFQFNGTKWSDEFALSEDISLGVKDNVSVTVREESAVLQGMKTPGAVVYFNEFNAMPEAVQLYLNSLLDESRAMFLRTSGGKPTKSAEQVLFIASMNPEYEGTNPLQEATENRLHILRVHYPPLTKPAAPDDPNQNPVYSASEAMRMARVIPSLLDLTTEAKLEDNEFVKLWDKYVNGIDTGASEPTLVQKFDLEVMLFSIQFVHILRDAYIKHKEGTATGHDLPVRIPITGRDLYNIATVVKLLPDEAKPIGSDPEQLTKDLIEDWIIERIKSSEDRIKVKNRLVKESTKWRTKN